MLSFLSAQLMLKSPHINNLPLDADSASSYSLNSSMNCDLVILLRVNCGGLYMTTIRR